jgi:hypothetical protein
MAATSLLHMLDPGDYVGSGDYDKAFEWLEKAYPEKSVFMAFLNLEPLFEPLHSDPRWSDHKRRVGITN